MHLDAFHVLGQVGENVLYQFPLLIVQMAVFILLEGFPHFIQQFLGRFGEILDEVQRVPDFMGHAGRELAQRCQFLLRDDAVLRRGQVGHRLFQFVVLAVQLRVDALQFRVLAVQFVVLAIQPRVDAFQLRVLAFQLLRQFLHQVQPDCFLRVATKHLQRRRHVGHFVAPADVHLHVQVSARHPPHPLRQQSQAVQQHPAHEEPRDEQRSANADEADDQQQRSPGQYRLRRCVGGRLRPRFGDHHQRVHLVNQESRDPSVVLQQQLLALVHGQLLGAHLKSVARRGAQFQQTIKNQRQFGVQRRALQVVQVSSDVAGRRLKPLPERLNQRAVGHDGRAGEQLGSDFGVGLQFGQVAIPGLFYFGKMRFRGRPGLVKFPISGLDVEELTVNFGYDDAVQFGSQRFQFHQQRV